MIDHDHLTILGTDGDVVPLSELFAVLEGYLDYAGLHEQFPGISDSDIIAALSFAEALLRVRPETLNQMMRG